MEKSASVQCDFTTPIIEAGCRNPAVGSIEGDHFCIRHLVDAIAAYIADLTYRRDREDEKND